MLIWPAGCGSESERHHCVEKCAKMAESKTFSLSVSHFTRKGEHHSSIAVSTYYNYFKDMLAPTAFVMSSLVIYVHIRGRATISPWSLQPGEGLTICRSKASTFKWRILTSA